jgi:hypothetical protein
VVDYVKKHCIFVVDAVQAWVDTQYKDRRFFHAVGDGWFIVDGEKISHRRIMSAKVPEGV